VPSVSPGGTAAPHLEAEPDLLMAKRGDPEAILPERPHLDPTYVGRVSDGARLNLAAPSDDGLLGKRGGPRHDVVLRVWGVVPWS
jgi:hypothetical protein